MDLERSGQGSSVLIVEIPTCLMPSFAANVAQGGKRITGIAKPHERLVPGIMKAGHYHPDLQEKEANPKAVR